ncbi:MAG TPA: CHAD domain-containing protein [Actinomycetota bacterium]|nr:CHAD domain-containing protein [Actinomycetota bacterium]
MIRQPASPVGPGLFVPVPGDFGPTTVDPTLGAGDVAFAVMRAQFVAMLKREPGVRYGNDAEDLHQMRVAIRRVRAAMVVFEEALPARAPRLRQELGWLGSLLGAVRDLDVQLEQIGAWSAAAEPAEREALDVVTAVLDDRRTKARARLVAAMDSRRLIRLNTSMERFLVHGPIKRSPSARVPILEAAPEVVAHGYRKVVAIGDHISDGSPPQALHALRIRAKRLRYTVEFLEPIYGKPARAYAKRLVDLQDVLGRHQDDVVAIATLREIALDPPQKIGQPIVFALGTLAERYRTDASGARARFPKRYRNVVGDRWRKLRRTMEDQRPAPPEPVAPEAPAVPEAEQDATPIKIVRGLP